MGTWELRCMVSGLPLTANDPATAVLLTGTGSGYRPVTLGLQGIYNCYGTIDTVVEDVNARLVWRYALDRLADGRLIVSDDEPLSPDDDIDRLLEVVERNVLALLDDDPSFGAAITLDGAELHQGLISQPVWDALSTPDQAPVGALFDRVFGGARLPRELYGGRLAEVAGEVARLAAVDAFLTARGLAWAPPGDERQRYASDPGAQFDPAELRSFVEEARRDWWEVEALRPVIDAADRAVREREEEALSTDQGRLSTA